MNPKTYEALRAALQARVDARAIPGAVMCVQRGGETWCDAVGALRPDGPAMTADAIFRIYSMTKPIASVAALMLVEQGRLLLTDPVSKWLPSFANQRVLQADGSLAPVARDATVHDLMRHTAGLSYGWEPGPIQKAYMEARIGSRGLTNQQTAEALGPLPLERQPGSAWAYSRATDVLGAVIERVADTALGEFLQRRIFAPLGMNETGFHVPEKDHHRIAGAFPPGEGEVTLADVRQPAPLESGGGGLVSTAADYARFGALLLNGGTLDGVRLVGPHTLKWMASDHLGAIPRADDILPDGYGFGLGVAVRLAQGLAARAGSPGAYGWSGMAGTVFSVDPQLGMFSMVLTQAPAQLGTIADLLPNTLYGAL